jgi:hypothetical protein
MIAEPRLDVVLQFVERDTDARVVCLADAGIPADERGQ